VNARRAVMLAHDEAEALGHRAVRSEHLLLGLWMSGGTAWQLLSVLQSSAAAARQELATWEQLDVGEADGFDAAVRRTFVHSFEIARMLNSKYIETEHLLGPLISDTDGGAARLLWALGIDPSVIRQRVAMLYVSCDQETDGNVQGLAVPTQLVQVNQFQTEPRWVTAN
jgi:ATP-dependent Clp protease ATP-binding subunit ClpA